MKDLFEYLDGIINAIKGRKTPHYSVKMRSEIITESKRLNDTRYCGWLAVNIGESGVVRIFNVPLQPGEGLSSQSIVNMQPGDVWSEPIDIQVEPGGKLQLLRTLASEIR